MPSSPATLLQLIRHSNVVRILMLFLLVILFQVPIFAIDGMIRERQQRRDAALEEVEIGRASCRERVCYAV